MSTRRVVASATPSSGLGDRVGSVVALVALGAVLVLAGMINEAPRADRLGRRVRLIELIAAERARGERLAAQVERLATQVGRHQERSGLNQQRAGALRRDVAGVAAAAGFTAVVGRGVRVTLSDSTLTYSPQHDPNDLVIHEQDLQAVINALWAGGAEAMSVNRRRILATTAIRCVGNTLLLDGRLYPPPYRIEAVGDTPSLREALSRDPAVQALAAVADSYRLGFAVADAPSLRLAAHEGAAALGHARPVEASG